MSVTFTQTKKLLPYEPYGGRWYLLTYNLAATGDASAGTVNATVAIDDLVRPTDHLWLKSVTELSTEVTASQYLVARIFNNGWNTLYPSSDWSGLFALDKKNGYAHLYPENPIYIGRTGDAPTTMDIYVEDSKNGNGASYTVTLNFLVWKP